jgi:NAD dependent epimerase/dehydratase
MPESLEKKRALVTGADGFIGSHLVEQLVRNGASVRAFSHYNAWNNIGWLADADPKLIRDVEIFRGDVRDAERVRQAVHGCDYVFHLSSLIGIPYSYDAPRSYVETNVTGALNVLEACRHSDSLIRLVHTSTSEVYGTAQTVPISETHPLVGQSPYSATKIAADKLAESFHLSFKLPVATARPFNTYGPRQTARAVIPTIASQLLSGGDSLKLGSLTTTRDFNYVLDTVTGMMALALSHEAEGRAINIGTGREWSIEHTARLLMEITGRKIPIVCEDERIRPAESEVSRLIADNTLIKSLTGWTPQTDFREGLEQTVKWIKRNLGLFNPMHYSV